MSTVALRSAIYRGRIRHRRFEGTPREFEYRTAALLLDLDELDDVFRGRWLWSAGRANVVSFRNEDHLDGRGDALAPRVRDLVFARTGRRPDGPIALCTMPRYFGYVFNPVSFFYCRDAAGARVETIVAEVGNTPWNERHCYVLVPSADEGAGPRHRWRFAKTFHVSPFQGMDTRYDWRFVDPGERLVVHMDCLREGRAFFDATMVLARREISGASLAATLARHPFLTGKTVAAIYWQALLLWLRGATFHPHPATHTTVVAAEVSP